MSHYIQHEGNTNPVGNDTMVECLTRCGFVYVALSHDVDWKHTDDDYDVMHYRILGNGSADANDYFDED